MIGGEGHWVKLLSRQNHQPYLSFLRSVTNSELLFLRLLSIGLQILCSIDPETSKPKNKYQYLAFGFFQLLTPEALSITMINL
jgi:hypothetical protein